MIVWLLVLAKRETVSRRSRSCQLQVTVAHVEGVAQLLSSVPCELQQGFFGMMPNGTFTFPTKDKLHEELKHVLFTIDQFEGNS